MRRRVFLLGSALAPSVMASPPRVDRQLVSSTPMASASLLHSEHVAAFIKAVCTQNVNKAAPRNLNTRNLNISRIGGHAKTHQALAQFGGDVSVECLLDWSGYSQALDAENFVRAFNVRKNKDFIDSKTVLLERWVVSRAELALCTLTDRFLMQGHPA